MFCLGILVMAIIAATITQSIGSMHATFASVPAINKADISIRNSLPPTGGCITGILHGSR